MIRNRDRCIGAYIGAAIGDAMGGPVECNHFARIKRYVGRIKGFLPYQKPHTLFELQPGYALHPDAGSVTDDTFIRKDLTRFYLETRPPRTPQMLVDWLLENAELDRQWPKIMVGALYKIKRGEVTAEECGLTYKQGGGIGWWTPVAILHAGDPEKAAAEGRYLSRIWKAPLEQDLLAAVVAGISEGLREDASFDSMLAAMLKQCGPLAKQLLERSIDIANEAKDVWDLAERLYNNVLIADHSVAPYNEKVHELDPPTSTDAPMPPSVKPVEYTDKAYATCFFAEQVPLSLAAFVFAKGDVDAIPICCSLGRDCDSTSTSVGAWVGALHGESGLPKEWVDTVCKVNMNEIDIRSLAEQITALEE